jgi:hypothetical protein
VVLANKFNFISIDCDVRRRGCPEQRIELRQGPLAATQLRKQPTANACTLYLKVAAERRTGRYDHQVARQKQEGLIRRSDYGKRACRFNKKGVVG